MDVKQLIADWHAGKVKAGDLVKVSGPIIADSEECWLSSTDSTQQEAFKKELSLQLIEDTDILFENIPPMMGGDLAYYFEEALIEGKVCKPTVPGFSVALKEITSLWVTDGELSFVGLGKEEPHRIEVTIGDDGQTQVKKIRSGEKDENN